MKKLLTLTGIAGYRRGLGAIGSVSDHHRYRRCHGPERVLALAVGLQDNHGHGPKAATGSESTHCGQGHSRALQREVVLRVSHCDEGQDLRRETSPIQQV